MCLKQIDMDIPFISIKVDVDNREGNGTPLQYSCLENAMNGGAWWATAHSVTQSWTRLKQLSMRASIPLLQNIDYIAYVVQHILESILHPVGCTPTFSLLYYPIPFLL